MPQLVGLPRPIPTGLGLAYLIPRLRVIANANLNLIFIYISESAHVLYKQNWTIEALDPLRKFEASVLKEINVNHKLLVRRWTFSDSLFYSVTILTTIGEPTKQQIGLLS